MEEQEKKPFQPKSIIVDVAEVRKNLGQMQDETIAVYLDPVRVIDSFSTEKEITGSLVLQSIDRGVVLTGNIHFEWRGDCRRCLEVTSGVKEVSVSEVFQVGADEESEATRFDGTHLDLLPVVRDAVASSLPLVPLCDESCRGPAPDEYPTILGGVKPASDEPDPRWDVLNQLDFD